MKKNDLIPAMIWVALGIAVAVGSYKLQLGTLRNPGPGLMPFLLGIILLLCSLPILVRSLMVIKIKAKQGDGGIWSGVQFKRLILVLASLVGYGMIIEEVGFIVSTFFLLFVLFKIIGSRKWLFALITSVIVVLLSYLLFVVVLDIELPSGIWRIG